MLRKTKPSMIDKTKVIDILELQAKIADLFEVEPRSFDEFVENGEDVDSFPVVYLSHIRKYVMLKFDLADCSDFFSLDRICVAAIKDRVTFVTLNYSKADFYIIGIRFKPEIKSDMYNLGFPKGEPDIIHRELRSCTIQSEIFVDDFLRDAGYFDALESSPCHLTSYIKPPKISWRTGKTPAELLEYDQQRRKVLHATRVKREIAAGLRDPETGKLLNAKKPGPAPTLTPEEAAANARRSKLDYYYRNKQAEIDAGLRDPETGKLIKDGRVSTETTPEEIVAKAQARREYKRQKEAEKRKLARQAEIDAGIRDADGKLIK